MSIRVFIVEDQPRQLATMEAKVSDLGYVVVGSGGTTSEGLHYFRSNSADVVLMDINLRNGNEGIALAAIIREQHAVPVIYVTAMSTDDVVRDAINTGPSGYLLKPVDPVELRANIELAVQKNDLSTLQESPKQDYLTVRLGHKLLKTYFKDISHLKIEDKNYVTLVDRDQKQFAVRGSLSNLLSTVFPESFLRTHHSFGINLEFVQSIDEPTQSIRLLTGEFVPIGKMFKKEVYRRMNIA